MKIDFTFSGHGDSKLVLSPSIGKGHSEDKRNLSRLLDTLTKARDTGLEIQFGSISVHNQPIEVTISIPPQL